MAATLLCVCLCLCLYCVCIVCVCIYFKVTKYVANVISYFNDCDFCVSIFSCIHKKIICNCNCNELLFFKVMSNM